MAVITITQVDIAFSGMIVSETGLVKIHCNFKQPRIFIYNLLLYIKTITNYSKHILFLLIL
jgi:hypothetical protein